MTSPAAAALYEAQHLCDMQGRRVAVYNPAEKPLDTLPTIFGFNNGGLPGWMSGVLLAEDGEALGSHVCSSEGYMPHDLGILDGCRSDRHETFRAHYPDGYKMEFVSGADVRSHAGLNAAVVKHQAKHSEGAE